jgi:hypothetical protein
MVTLTESGPKLALRLPLRVIGALILVAGLTASWWVWRTQDRDQELEQEQLNNPSAPLAVSDSRKQSRNVEIYYGKTGLLVERWSERLEPWSHGKPLAEIIAVISLVSATGCFFLAARLPN